jgi:putative transposase
MAEANRLWGAPRIHGELLKPGIDVAERTVSRLIPKRRIPPSQTWRTFLTNHVRDLAAIDFFTVPTAHWRVLFVLVVLAHHRRRVLHFNVTEHPTAEWTAQQIVDAFPEDTAPSYLLRDRDTIYGHAPRQRVTGMRILSERHLRRILARYFAYYHRARTHLSLEKDAPDVRPIERPERGPIRQIPEVGGLHHRYVRRAA